MAITPRSPRAPQAASFDEIALHRQAIARAPVLPRESQIALTRRMRRERDAFLAAAHAAPEVVAALLERWRALRAAGRSTGVLSVHHVEAPADRDLSSEIDRALARAARLRAAGAPAATLARALTRAELSVEAVVHAFRASAQHDGADSLALAEARAGFAAWIETRDTLVRHNLRLVLRFVRPFRAMNVPLGDLVQEGCIGLTRAVEKFDPERGIGFSTYAAWWIQQALIRVVQKESRTIRVPSNVHDAQARFRRAEDALRAACGEPTRSEVAAALGLSADEADRLAASAMPIVSTDAPVAGSESLVVEDLLAAEDDEDPAASHDLRVFAGALPAMLAPLDARERAVLAARFGLDGGEAETLSEVGARLGLSRERVRQIEARALARIRTGAVARRLVSWRPVAAHSAI